MENEVKKELEKAASTLDVLGKKVKGGSAGRMPSELPTPVNTPGFELPKRPHSDKCLPDKLNPNITQPGPKEEK